MRSLVVERKSLSDSEACAGGTGSIVTITATCDRFLWNMMRRIAGTLVQVGLGKMTESEVGELLAANGRPTHLREMCGEGQNRRICTGKSESKQLVVYTAPARGLCLDHVFYEHDREVEGNRYTPC